MIDKDFKELSMGEKFQLQKIMKKKRKGEELLQSEQALYNRFSEEFTAAEKVAKSKWPIIIGLLIASLLVILRKCQ
ncbi:MAG: hypothetical protein GY714_05500 [Desulfobacterales bacterium]|nr:hypothetical protein [Desulfobacterales bacterium]